MVPNLKLYVGPMFSGKSTKLLEQVDRYQIAKKNVFCVKPALDTRYSSEGFIVTHNGAHLKCYMVSRGEELIEKFEKENLEKKIDAIAVDEAFMIDNISESLLNLFYTYKIDVLVSSIDMSASKIPFSDISELLSHATHIKKCKAVCTVCGTDAPYTLRKFELNDNGEQIRVGGSDLYEPRCLRHHSNIDL